MAVSVLRVERQAVRVGKMAPLKFCDFARDDKL